MFFQNFHRNFQLFSTIWNFICLFIYFQDKLQLELEGLVNGEKLNDITDQRR